MTEFRAARTDRRLSSAEGLDDITLTRSNIYIVTGVSSPSRQAYSEPLLLDFFAFFPHVATSHPPFSVHLEYPRSSDQQPISS